MSTEAQVRPPVVPLRANRDFRLLWIGQALSGLGSSMTFLVVPLLLLAAGYPPAVVGTLGTVTLVVGLLVRMPGGMIADRFDLRRVMLVCDLVQLVALGAAAVCVFFVPLPVAVALAMVVLAQFTSEAYRPASAKLLRRIVPIDQIATAVSVNQARGYGASIIAPSVGGVLLTLDPALPFVVDALTFGASAVCVLLLATSHGRVPRPVTAAPAEPVRAKEPLRRQALAGWHHLVRDRFLRTASAYFAVLNLLFSTLLYALVLGLGQAPGGAVAAGMALSASALTGLLGSLAAPWAQRTLSLPVVLAIGPGMAAGLLALAWTGAGALAFAGAFAAMCLMTPVISAVLATVVARTVPEAIYGRVNASTTLVSQILQPLGPLVAGVLLTRLPLTGTASVFLAVFAVLAALAFLLPAPTSVPTPVSDQPG